MPALLALLTALTWGVADFLGGAYSRRLPTATVMFFSQVAGLAAVAVVLALGGWHSLGSYVWWGIGGSCIGTLAGALFYQGLALGTMSVVAPIAGTGLVVPVVVGLLQGERPHPLQLAGIALAAAGVDPGLGPSCAVGRLAAVRGLRSSRPPGSEPRSPFFPARLAGQCADDSPRPRRLASFLLTTTYSVVRRPSLARPAPDIGGIATMGFMNVLAVITYGLAVASTLIAVSAVLASLYPVVTVLLAQWIYTSGSVARSWRASSRPSPGSSASARADRP